MTDFADAVVEPSSIPATDDASALPVGGLHVEWEPLTGVDLFDRPEDGSDWIVVSWGPNALADRLAKELQQHDSQRVVERLRETNLAVGDELRRAIEGKGASRVVFVADGSSPAPARGAISSPDWQWAHALIRCGQSVLDHLDARLWIVTASGLIGPAKGAVARPEQCFAWGLGRCHAAEAPRSWGGLVEVKDPDSQHDVSVLARFLSADCGEDEAVVDGGELYVPRLARHEPEAAHALPADALRGAVVTGGLKGLSFELCLWLARSGVRQLTVIGHSALDESRRFNLGSLRAICPDVVYEVVDVGDAHAVAAFGQRMEDGERCGGAFFHLASSWQKDGKLAVTSLAAAQRDSTDEVLHAKAQGAILLGQLVQGAAPGLFVLFSTAAASLGSPGQANYAAASCVLDGVARQFEGSPTRALSIAWGPIADAGFAASDSGAQLHELWARIGLKQLSVPAMLETLGSLVHSSQTHPTVVEIDVADEMSFPWLRDRRLFSNLGGDGVKGIRLAELDGLDDEGRVACVCAILRENLAAILNLPADQLREDQPLVDLGVDSLVSLEMLFTVDRDFAVTLGFDESLLGIDVTLRTIAAQVVQRIPVRSID